MLVYADSSVLAKRHLPERGSHWVRQLTAPRSGNRVATARLTLVEVISALNRRVREGSLSATDYAVARNDFLARCRRSYCLVPITNALLTQARTLLERHPLRAYEALHLASALAVQQQMQAAGLAALTFLAADDRLLSAARAEGLLTDNPDNHP